MKHINAKTERGYKRALTKRLELFSGAFDWVVYCATLEELNQMARKLADRCSVSLKFARETVVEFLMAKYLACSNLELADDNICEWFHDISAYSHWVSPKCWNLLTESEKEIERKNLSIYREAICDAGNFEIVLVDLENIQAWAEEAIQKAEEAAKKAVVAKKALRKLGTTADGLRGMSVAAEGDPENKKFFELVLGKLTDAERDAVLDYLWH